MHSYHTSLFLFTILVHKKHLEPTPLFFWLTEFLTYVTTPYCMYVRKVRTKDTQHNWVGLGLVPVHSLLLLLCSDKSCDRQRGLYLWQGFSSQWVVLLWLAWKQFQRMWQEYHVKNIMWLLLYLILIISLCAVGQVVQVWLLLVHNNKGYWMLASCWMCICFCNVAKWNFFYKV